MQDQELLPATGSGVTEYRQTEAALAELRQQFEGHTFDCSTTAGDREARQSRMALVRLRVTLEERRKELKAPILERGRLLDDEAKRITAEIVKLELPIDTAIREQERIREEARAERERVEAARVSEIRKRIEAIRSMPLELVSAPSSVVSGHIVHLEADELDEDTFAELLPEAKAARESALGKLEELLAASKQNEKLQAELREQREAQERAAAEAAEKLAAEHAEREREHLARLAEEQAERDRLAEEQRLENERIQAEQAAREKALAEREAEQRRIQREAQEKAEAERQQRMAEEAERLRLQEQEAIDKATLREAATEALDCLTNNVLPLEDDDIDVIRITRHKLAAALAKEPQA